MSKYSISGYSISGYSLDETGSPLADVICPHGKPVEQINRWDHSLNPSEQIYRITAADLDEWLAENGPWLGDLCLGHI